MKKFKLFINYDKEEKWLNEMAKKGYELEDVSFGHKFRFTKPQNTIIRIDYRTFKNKEGFIDYCVIFEDSGWQHIAGTKNSGTQYFKKIGDNSEDYIFSDNMSKALRYRRLSDMWLMLVASYLIIFLPLVSLNYIDVNSMLNPKLLYYTPGLWEMSGTFFWKCFLFETPFAVSRGFLWLGIPIAIVLYFSFSIKAKILYYKQRKYDSKD